MKLATEIIIRGRLIFYVLVGDEATVESLKEVIADKEGFEEKRLILMHRNGRLLKNDQCSLRDYGVCNGTIIYILFKPLGESEWPVFFPNTVTFFVKER